MAEQDSRRWDVFHRWINHRHEGKTGAEWDHSLYEWRNMLGELQRLPYWLRAARTGTLRTTHQQCSRQPEEPLPENQVICALGTNVLQCPILQDWYAVAQQERERTAEQDAKWSARWAEKGRKYKPRTLPPEADDQTAAEICCWHIFTEGMRRSYHLDTSEGYVQDESDRRFWRNTYASMAASDDDYDEEDGDTLDGLSVCSICGGPSLAGLDHRHCTAERKRQEERQP